LLHGSIQMKDSESALKGNSHLNWKKKGYDWNKMQVDSESTVWFSPKILTRWVYAYKQDKIGGLIDSSGIDWEVAGKFSKDIFNHQGMPWRLKLKNINSLSNHKNSIHSSLIHLRQQAFCSECEFGSTSIFEAIWKETFGFPNGNFTNSVSDEIKDLSISLLQRRSIVPIWKHCKTLRKGRILRRFEFRLLSKIGVLYFYSH